MNFPLMCAGNMAVQFQNPNAASLSPNTGDAAGGTAVTITGTGLGKTTGVTFGGVAAASVIVVSNTSVTCVTPAGSGVVNVVVTTGIGTSTLVGAFTYTGGGGFTVDSIDPNAAPEAGGDAVQISGTGFTNGVITVQFGLGNLATGVSFVSATKINCTTPAGTGTVDVIVTIDAVPGTLSAGFTYEP